MSIDSVKEMMFHPNFWNEIAEILIHPSNRCIWHQIKMEIYMDDRENVYITNVNFENLGIPSMNLLENK